MHICRIQSQVPFSGVCAHLRNGTGTYHLEVREICVQTSDIYKYKYIYIDLLFNLSSLKNNLGDIQIGFERTQCVSAGVFMLQSCANCDLPAPWFLLSSPVGS